MGAEIDEQGNSLFDTGDRAQTVLVVGDLVAYPEALGGRLGIGRFERAGLPGDAGARRGKGSLSPVWACLRRGPQEVACVARVRGGIWACGGVSGRLRAGRTASGVQVPQYLRVGGQQAKHREE